MHGLVDAPHVDHLHPDSGIAIATAAEGPALTKEIFGDRVLWVPWRRPGFQLGLDIAAVARANPQAIGCVLGSNSRPIDAEFITCSVRLPVSNSAPSIVPYWAEHGRPSVVP